ncbi:putative gustatory receptor 2a [Schistocerca piceifrons]|uniref:putative gustatory receptor 2a n=1 Tax=Schistocerca piceifrons TaxID=274613 RepID=UPI001F5EBA94|nr:putative gustatory receptor 2a [Schistocerca piceifrons]
MYLEALEYSDECVLHKERQREKMPGVLLTCVSVFVVVAESALSLNYARREVDGCRILFWILYTVYRLVDNLLVLQLTLLVLELRVRFHDINDVIVTTTGLHSDKRLSRILLDCSRTTEEFRQPAVNQLHHAHAVLYRAAELLQRHFGFTVALQVTAAYSSLLYGSYEILMLSVGSDKGRGIVLSSSILYSVVWVASHLLGAVAVVLSCSATANEAERTRVLVVRADTLRQRQAVWTNMGALLRQLMATQPLSFKAAGFLTIDRRLLMSSLCATITYLVILSQISLD